MESIKLITVKHRNGFIGAKNLANQSEINHANNKLWSSRLIKFTTKFVETF